MSDARDAEILDALGPFLADARAGLFAQIDATSPMPDLQDVVERAHRIDPVATPESVVAASRDPALLPEPIETQELANAGSVFLTRPSLAHYSARREELERRAADLFGWVAAGELSLRIDRQLPLAEAAEAQRLLASRATAGKLILVP